MNPIKLRLIFAYYINTTYVNIDYDVYKWHLANLSLYISNFDIIDFYLCIDDVNDIETIETVKTFILNYLNNVNINFIVTQNNSYYREGNIFVNQIINRLEEYANNNELIMFAHTKGLTNQNDNNSFNWINLLYYSYCDHLWEVIYRLADDAFNIITYGGLYNYSLSNLTKYKWMFMGGFNWISAKRLYNYMKNNNIKFNYSLESNIRVAAEAFLPNILDVDKIWFYECDHFNLYNNSIKYERDYFPYDNILYIGALKMTAHTYNKFYNEYQNKIISLIK